MSYVSRYKESIEACSERSNSLDSTLEETNEINRRMTQEIEDTQNEIKRITECHDAVVNQLNDLQKKSPELTNSVFMLDKTYTFS